MKKEILYFLVALLGGMLFGYDTAVINGAMPFFTAYFQLTDAMVGWSVSSGLLGCILGAAFASYPADRIGRRETMKIVAFCSFCRLWEQLSPRTLHCLCRPVSLAELP